MGDKPGSCDYDDGCRKNGALTLSAALSTYISKYKANFRD